MSGTHLVVCIEGVSLSAALIQHNAKSPDVALLIVRLVLTQLWAKVVGGAHNGLCKVCVRAEDLSRRKEDRHAGLISLLPDLHVVVYNSDMFDGTQLPSIWQTNGGVECQHNRRLLVLSGWYSLDLGC